MKHTHILVIRPGAIGDVLLTFPVLQALREAYVNPQITLASNAVVLPLALASGIVDEVFDYQDIRWSELFSEAGIRSPAVRGLLAQSDLAICWLRDPDHIVEQNLREAGVKRVVVAPGRPPEGIRVHIVDYLAGTVGLSASWFPTPGGASTPFSLSFSSCCSSLSWSPIPGGASTPSPHPPQPPPLRGEYTALSNLRQIAIHPGSGGAAKCWPAENFAEVIKRLWQQNRPVLLLAGPADDDRLESILQAATRAPSPPPYRSLLYRDVLKSELLQVLANKPLLEVAHHLQACRCYLGNDAGITHLAAILGVPTVAIFGPSDPAVWRPVGPNVTVIRKHTLERLAADAVMDAINSFI